MSFFDIPLFKESLITFIIFLLLREICAYKKITALKYILSPLVTISIIPFVLIAITEFSLTSYTTLILFSLIIAAVADTFMVIDDINLIKYGVVFFMLGHCCYIAAFIHNYVFSLWHLLLATGLLTFIILLFMKIRSKTGGLDIPVFFYIFIICVMVYFAIGGLSKSINISTILAAAGAVVFMTSDFVIAINEFIKKIPNSTVITWALYAPGQLLIALSCFI